MGQLWSIRKGPVADAERKIPKIFRLVTILTNTWKRKFCLSMRHAWLNRKKQKQVTHLPFTAVASMNLWILETVNDAAPELSCSMNRSAAEVGRRFAMLPDPEICYEASETWLGDIPESWSALRIGDLFELRSTKVSDEDYRPLSVTKKGIVPQLDSVAKSDNHANRKLVKEGDFAINSRSDRRNSCGFSPYDGSVSTITTVLFEGNQLFRDTLTCCFDTPRFAEEFYRWGHGIDSDIWTTNWSDMKKIVIPCLSIK